MTDIEKKALALAIETRVDDRYRLCPDPTLTFGLWEALCRAIEQHEAFRQEVSDAVEELAVCVYDDSSSIVRRYMGRFILAKPDPLVEAFEEIHGHQLREGETWPQSIAQRLRAALAARGLTITETKE